LAGCIQIVLKVGLVDEACVQVVLLRNLETILRRCSACYSHSKAINRTLFVDLAIIGWRQLVLFADFGAMPGRAALALCLGFAFLERRRLPVRCSPIQQSAP
jgi:hypothetical protein